ncbi:MAG: hypothetical protein V3V06_02785, partial [Dehalococcoidia bacterium]
ATVESEELKRRVEDRIATLPAVNMTAMQTMASFLWLPLMVMGVAMLASGAIIAGVNSFRVDEFFGFNIPGAREAIGLGDPDLGDLRTFRSVQTWLPGYQFMGMGLMFASITMVVAAILGRLRILGGTVQASLGARIIYPPFPMAARIFPMLMMFGLIVFLTQLGLSAWLATEAKAGDFLTVDTHADWVQGMRLAAVAIMLSGIALALFTITGLMRFLAERVREVASEALEAED